jgi:hypothetical protein
MTILWSLTMRSLAVKDRLRQQKIATLISMVLLVQGFTMQINAQNGCIASGAVIESRVVEVNRSAYPPYTDLGIKVMVDSNDCFDRGCQGSVRIEANYNRQPNPYQRRDAVWSENYSWSIPAHQRKAEFIVGMRIREVVAEVVRLTVTRTDCR